MEATAPIVNALNRPFWDAAAAGVLLLPYCLDSGRAFWPPAPSSPFTGGEVAWRQADVSGDVESVVVYRRAFQRAFADRLPYGIALVALDAGPRLLAHVERPDASDAPHAGDRARIGFRVLFEGGAALPIAVSLFRQD